MWRTRPLVSGRDLARRGQPCFRIGGSGRQSSRRCRGLESGRSGGGNGRAPWAAAFGFAVAAVEAAARGRHHLAVARGERQKEDQEEGADHLGSHRRRHRSSLRRWFCYNSLVLRSQQLCDARGVVWMCEVPSLSVASSFYSPKQLVPGVA